MTNDKLTVLFPSTSGNPYHELLFEKLKNNGVIVVRGSKPVFFPLTRTFIKNTDIDVIHLDWLHHFYTTKHLSDSTILNTFATFIRAALFYIDIVLMRLVGVSVVWTVHNKHHHEQYYSRIERILQILVANTVNDLSVKCQFAKSLISKLFRVKNTSKIHIIPDGNYIGYYKNSIGKQTAKKQLGSDDKFIYLFFGTILPYKGVLDLISKFSSIDEEDSELWIVGNPQTETIEHQIKTQSLNDGRINTRLDFIPDDEVQYYLNAADVLVFPYRDILNSGSVHLGMSFGKPIIVPQIGCIPETISHENILSYDPSIDDGLYNSLIQAKHVDLDQIGRANYQQAQKFDWESVSSMYYNIYI